MKQLKWLRVLLVLSCWQVGAMAATTSVTQQADGFGDTPQVATGNALVNAARQALGVAVTLDPDFRKQSMDWVIHQNKNGNVITQHWSDAPEARLPTLAGIQGYKVKTLTQVNKALWKASVEARIAKNKSLRPERDKLTSVVVLPFAPARQTYDLQQPASAADVSTSLQRALMDSLTQSGQVRVLDRSHQDARAAEQLQSAVSLSPAERAKLGQGLGADLLLTGSIDTLQLGRPEQQSYGPGDHSLALHARMHYQLMDVATGDILAADVVTYDPPAAALVAAFHEAHIIPDTEPDRLGEVIYPRVATVLANKVLNIIAPLQILKVVGTDSIYVSGGKGRLAVGDTLAVTTGTTVVNPQTDAVMKADHVTGAELEVTQVGMGYAVAKLMQGKPGDVRNGSQLQKLVDQLPPAAAIYPMTPGSSEAPVHWN